MLVFGSVEHMPFPVMVVIIGVKCMHVKWMCGSRNRTAAFLVAENARSHGDGHYGMLKYSLIEVLDHILQVLSLLLHDNQFQNGGGRLTAPNVTEDLRIVGDARRDDEETWGPG